MAIINVTRAVSLTSTNYLNLPATFGINANGLWFYYIPNAGNASLLANIKPYRWDTPLPLVNSASTMQIEGTIAMITESWEGASVQYHGSSNIWVGNGVNDITAQQEDNAFFFGHLGSLSPATDDDAYYWDRAYLAAGTTNWAFYQYHKHLPTTYIQFENGRQTFSADGYLNPADKAYGYMISTQVKVSNTTYYTVLARIHTPSIGGAHNSHNDVTLPTAANRNYMPGGIVKGIGERYHAFYISASGSDWEVFNRTYTQASGTFTVQVSLGVYDLADPTYAPAALTGTQSQHPIRASNGAAFGSRIYIPIIFNNAVSGFDLRIWSFNSLDTIAGGSLISTTLISNATFRPDAHVTVVGSKLYVAATDATGGGAKLFSFDGTTWTDEGTIVTNSNTKGVRIHGFKYNGEDTKFYVLMSGTSAGTSPTYTGPGMYTFQLDSGFAGYKHLDYDATNNQYINRNALTSGHLRYTQTTGTVTRVVSNEPAGIASGTNILTYGLSSPVFYNKTQFDYSSNEYYYHGITLRDGRKFLAGRIVGAPNSLGSGDLFFTIRTDDDLNSYHFAWGGAGDDYITGAFQSNTGNKVWITGYTKSELVERRDMQVHGFIRNLHDQPNLMQWVDVVKDSTGNYYTVGNHSGNYIVAAKYDYNFELVWQIKLNGGASTETATGISIDSQENLYISGTTLNSPDTASDALLVKIDKNSNLIWAKAYGTDTVNQDNKSVAVINKNGDDFVVSAVQSGTSTIFLVTSTAGAILEQNVVTNLTTNRIRNHASTPTSGQFLFAGNYNGDAKFGLCEIFHPTRMVRWLRTYDAGGTDTCDVTDIANVDAGTAGANVGYVMCGRNATSSMILKVSVTESAGNYTVTKAWARNIFNSSFNGLCTTAYNETIKYVYAVGYATSSGNVLMGMEEGFLAGFNNSDGSLVWQNVFGHDMNERLNSVILDVTGNNIVSVGWSESHSNSRDAILFRAWNKGFGTGTHSIEGSSASPYYYLASTASTAADNDVLTLETASANSAGSLALWTNSSATRSVTTFTAKRFDGAFGPDGVFLFYIGYVDLDKVQEYLNSAEYKQNQENGVLVNYTDSVFVFHQAGSVGDGSADDGNIFGYDIIETTNNSVGDGAGIVYVIGVTSADLQITNAGTSGVYDYVLVEMDPVTGHMDFYQNGDPSGKDEETYALTELANGKIAYTGRTTGNLGDATPDGGYDIFLGIFDRDTDTSNYYSIGSGLDDKGINIHDLGSNELIIAYSSYGALGNQTNSGSEDIGAIKFNYSTNTWGTAYQTGSTNSEIIEQNGKPSALVSNNQLAIVASSTGIFADDSNTYGALDIVLGLLDISAGTWKKYQIGSGANDVVSSISAFGDRLLIAGHSEASFGQQGNAITVEFDTTTGVNAKSAGS